MDAQTKISTRAAHPPVRVSQGEPGRPGAEKAFTDTFCIGRGSECDVQIDSSLASRRHAEVVFEEESWWIRDLGSTNGTFIGGERIERHRLEADTSVQFGRNGPLLHLRTEARAAAMSPPPLSKPPSTFERTHPAATFAPAPVAPATASKPPVVKPPDAGLERTEAPLPNAADAPRRKPRLSDPPQPPANTEPATPAEVRKSPMGRGPADLKPTGGESAPLPPSVDHYIGHYFGADGGPAGERTMMIRRAYTQVQQKQHRKYMSFILGALALCLIVGAYAVWQHYRVAELEQQAVALFNEIKGDEAELTQMRILLEARGDASLLEQLRELEETAQQKRALYEGYIEELGVRRPLTEEEEVIYKVARIFNESELEMPPDFVRAVRDMIETHWQGSGRLTFTTAVQRAEERGYTPFIVQTFQKYGLPPEFFYLAMQESVMNPEARGIPTRWGIAKGMWQFIPETGETYGLRTGPRADERVYDPQDERHDFRLSTDAAARYLREIQAKLTQASGLLAMASYNWGEGRVISRLEELMEGIPDNPEARSYWRFYTEYSDRMPAETKDYVLKIFSAAVIGENPRLFGFDMDNPLQEYMEGSTPATAANTAQ